MNRNRDDNRNQNLVVCQDKAYHMLLHVRLEALEGSGNPNYLKCSICHTWDAPENLRHIIRRGVRRISRHRSCMADRARAAYQAMSPEDRLVAIERQRERKRQRGPRSKGMWTITRRVPIAVNKCGSCGLAVRGNGFFNHVRICNA